MTEIQRYSICESCGSTQVARERRPNGDDRCMKCLNKWPSKETKTLIPEQDHIKAMDEISVQYSALSDKYQNLSERYFAKFEMLIEANQKISEQAKEIKQLKAENKQLSDELADRAVTAVRKMRNSPGGYNL